jgi:hypothetical protein
VLTAVIASAPAPSTARAISPRRAVLGESLAKIGFARAARTPRIDLGRAPGRSRTAACRPARWAREVDLERVDRASPSSRRASSTKSSALSPPMFVTTTVSARAITGSVCAR